MDKESNEDIITVELNTKASYKMALTYLELQKHYYLESKIQILLVRSMFYLVAEHTHIFAGNQFKEYIKKSLTDGRKFASRIDMLFYVLNKHPKERMDNL